MRAYEHRAIGDAATGAAAVNLGGESTGDRFLLSFGDVVALSGDFFRPAVGRFRPRALAGHVARPERGRTTVQPRRGRGGGGDPTRHP